MTEIPMPEDDYSSARSEGRPFGVAILALLVIILGVIVLFLGTRVLATTWIGLAGGGLLILVGLCIFYVGFGLWNMQNWAWMWAIAVAIIAAIASIGMQFWLGFIIAVVIIVYLNEPTIRGRFR